VSSRRFFQHPTVEAKQALALRYDKKPTDPWSGDHLGFFNTLGAVARTGPNKGKRSYAARGYFEANAQRPNLHLLCDALVTNVELNGGRAVGVNFTHEGRTHNVKAAKEIIVSCGALQTPQILELSGIGDPDVLKAAGVECKVVNKGVGANFQDHALTAVVWEVRILYSPSVLNLSTCAVQRIDHGDSLNRATPRLMPYMTHKSCKRHSNNTWSLKRGR